MRDYIKTICTINNWEYINSDRISGGDINSSFSVETDKGTYFLKINSAVAYPEMFAKEAEGLKALKQASLFKIPDVIATGEHGDKQYLFMELLEKSYPSKEIWKTFAEALAQLHKISNDYFGLTDFNYIGSLRQQNDYTKSWVEFYTSQRIIPLVEILFNKMLFMKQDVDAAEKLCNCLAEIFPEEAPSLVHGDLWGGNFMAVKSEKGTVPSIYDPAVYFGHREMDLGMTLLLGGFDNSIYDFYNDFFALEKNWRERVPLTQLYPLLVHAILFGGGYVSRCSEILDKWK